MNKTKVSLASLFLLSVFLILPLVQAAQPQVWFSEETEIVWEYTEEELDESLAVINTTTSFKKLNFTEIVGAVDHLNVSGKLYSATEEDVTTYGFENQTIWEYSSFSIEPDPIRDDTLMTKFVSLFNELNVNLGEIETLPEDNQTYTLMVMSLMTDTSLLAIFIVLAFVKAFGGYFIHEVNSSTIASVSDRQIEYTVGLELCNQTAGHWDNLTYSGDMDLTYGETSNVLLKSVCTSTLVGIEWNSSTMVYDTESVIMRFTHEIAYPSELVNDYPPTGPLIPGYLIWIFLGAITLAVIPLYFAAKRKR